MTGRLTGELGPRTRKVIYGELSRSELEAELPLAMRVDRAHVVMLAEQKLISPEAATGLLQCMSELEAADYEPLLGRPAPRGLYLMYEGYLIERLGADVGGVLHSGRSRNDLKACVTAMRFREWLLEYASQAIRLEAVLLSRARAYQSVVMPIYTHFQAAMPVTYGYYLLGIARALGRDIDALRSAAEGLRVSPLGASAVAGTDLPIDPERTATLLGFDAPTGHALDAVATRDTPLRLLGAAAALTVTLSRLGTDLQLWSTAEFGFVRFPDRLVGGSSAMPQKRNAFLLEHVKAKPGHVLGAYAAAGAMMSATPFTNSIEVGTEAVAAIWPGLRAAEESVLLCQVLVSGARPDPDRMTERAVDGFTAATSIANRLVQHGIPFRTAHQLVGDAVRRAVEAGSTDLLGYLDLHHLARLSTMPEGSEWSTGVSSGDGPPGWLDDLDLPALVRAHEHGGGPGSFTESHRQAVAGWKDHVVWLSAFRDRQSTATQSLTQAVLALPTASAIIGPSVHDPDSSGGEGALPADRGSADG